MTPEQIQAALAEAIINAPLPERGGAHMGKAQANVIAAAVMALVKPKPLVWEKSHMPGWNSDFHTVPTNYTIRCADENGWKWYCIGRGAFGWSGSPEAAQAAAQAHADAAHWANTPLADMIGGTHANKA